MDIPEIYGAPFHESSNRPHLMLGCEPTAIAVVFVVSIILGFSIPTWWGFVGTLILFFCLRQILREMAKEDPQLISVHHESQRYNQGFWTAKPLHVRRWRAE